MTYESQKTKRQSDTLTGAIDALADAATALENYLNETAMPLLPATVETTAAEFTRTFNDQLSNVLASV